MLATCEHNKKIKKTKEEKRWEALFKTVYCVNFTTGRWRMCSQPWLHKPGISKSWEWVDSTALHSPSWNNVVHHRILQVHEMRCNTRYPVHACTTLTGTSRKRNVPEVLRQGEIQISVQSATVSCGPSQTRKLRWCSVSHPPHFPMLCSMGLAGEQRNQCAVHVHTWTCGDMCTMCLNEMSQGCTRKYLPIIWGFCFYAYSRCMGR